jgi:hypothetical protein
MLSVSDFDTPEHASFNAAAAGWVAAHLDFQFE